MKFPSRKSICSGFLLLFFTACLGCFLEVSQVYAQGGGGGGGPQPPPCHLDSVIVNTPSCFGDCNGELNLIVDCNTTVYFNWLEFPGLNSPLVSGVCAGVYHFTVTDSVRCTIVDSIIVTSPPPINFTLVGLGTTCPGGCTGSVTVVPGDTMPYTFYWPGYMASGPVLGTLCQGTYSVIVTNNYGCSRIETADVGYIPPFQLNFSSTPSSCLTSCNGTATVTANGIPPFYYQWGTGPMQTTQTAFNLCTGAYIANVTDSTGCTVTDSVFINQLAPKNVDVSVVHPTCFGGCNGSATATIQSVGSYSYFWFTSPPQFSATAIGLCSGSYVVEVTDLQSGCQYYETAVVDDPVPPSVVLNVTSSNCNNICNGSIEAILNNNDPGLFEWSNGVVSPTDTMLCPGLYTVTVTDQFGCITSASAAVGSDPLAMYASNATCSNLCDGVAGLVLPFPSEWFIDWDTTPVQHAHQITDLCAGVYSVAIVDTSGCELNGSVEVFSSEPIIASATITKPTCENLCNGSIELAVSGNAPFHFLWNFGINDTLNSIFNLCAGNYSVAITDSIGCVLIDTFEVEEVIPATINYFTVPNSCSQVCDAVIEAIPASPNIYNFTWLTNPIQTGPVATGLCPGFNYVEVTNANGCVKTDSVMILDTSPLNVNFSSSQISCAGSCDGFLSCQAWGGHPSFSYQWSNGSLNPQIFNLCAGTYTVTVTDVYGCTGSSSKVLSDPTPLNVSYTFSSATCALCADGEINVNISGGSDPYIILLNPGGVVGPTIENLLPGLYSLCVVDNHNCSWCEDVFINDITGITDSEINHQQVKVYPNPFVDKTYLQIPVIENSANFRSVFSVIDVNGKIIEGFNIFKVASSGSGLLFELNSLNAAPGIYFYKLIIDDTKYFSGKLIVVEGNSSK